MLYFKAVPKLICLSALEICEEHDFKILDAVFIPDSNGTNDIIYT